ncbi:hypothetical protein PC116_g24835 [Phytophthora cactorum]|nr:hypothetical protein PC111_g20011 [Phytophthora cactorum]KAG2805108.1 hypothetical protein PC112_g18411 [Phytophthora cactorum]KAG4226761.1 hypothetical protein PC116_g24835 [Phytophthora cactorum]
MPRHDPQLNHEYMMTRRHVATATTEARRSGGEGYGITTQTDRPYTYCLPAFDLPSNLELWLPSSLKTISKSPHSSSHPAAPVHTKDFQEHATDEMISSNKIAALCLAVAALSSGAYAEEQAAQTFGLLHGGAGLYGAGRAGAGAGLYGRGVGVGNGYGGAGVGAGLGGGAELYGRGVGVGNGYGGAGVAGTTGVGADAGVGGAANGGVSGTTGAGVGGSTGVGGNAGAGVGGGVNGAANGGVSGTAGVGPKASTGATATGTGTANTGVTAQKGYRKLRSE